MNKTQIKKFRENYTMYDGPIGHDGLELAVTFDEKDDVKRLGAKWNPAPNGARGGHWSMPANKLDKEYTNGTVQQWLDTHQMIVGPQGTLTADDIGSHITSACDVHILKKPGTDDTLTFQIWEHFVGVTLSGAENNPLYMSRQKGRDMWEVSCTDGMRPVLVAAQPTS